MALDTAAKRYRMLNFAGPSPVSVVGPLPDGSDDAIERSHRLSLVFSASGGGDVTDPVLTSPDVADIRQTTVDLSVNISEAGDVFWYVSGTALQPNKADLEAGTGATAFGSHVASGSGVQTINNAGPLPAQFVGYAHFFARDAAGNESETVTTEQFTTLAALAPVQFSITPNGQTALLIINRVWTEGAGGLGGFTVTGFSGGAVVLGSPIGEDTDTFAFPITNRVVLADEVGGVFNFVQPGNGIEDGDGNDMPSFSAFAAVDPNGSIDTGINPTLVAARILESGDIELEYSAPVTVVDDDWSGHTFTFSGGALTGAYSSGGGASPSVIYAPSRSIGDAETATVAFAQSNNRLQNPTAGYVLGYSAVAFKEPRGFSLGGVVNLELSAGAQTSTTVTMKNVDGTAAVSIAGDTGAAFSKNGGAFGTTPTTVVSGDTLAVQVDGSAAYNTFTSAILTVGDLVAAFSAKTKRDPALQNRTKPITRLHRRR